MSLKTYRIPAFSGDAPESAVVFLHGLGDSGSGGLLEIGRIWQQALPTTEFLCPDAPFAFDMAPPDFGGRQWFSLQEFTRQSIEAGVREAAPILSDYIDGVLAALQLPPSKLALVGFSQGTMMSLDFILRRREPIAAVVGYSGMWGSGDFEIEANKVFPPVLLVHGTADDVVPFAAMSEAERLLKAAGIAVRSLACPGLGHSIDQSGIAAGMAFLQQNLR